MAINYTRVVYKIGSGKKDLGREMYNLDYVKAAI